MALATLNTQTINVVNGEVGIMQALSALADQADQLNIQFQQLTLATPLGEFPTYTPNKDGTIPTNGDPSPIGGNPIDPRQPNTAGLALGTLSANDYASMNTFLQVFVSLVRGQPVSQQGQAPGLFAKIENTG